MSEMEVIARLEELYRTLMGSDIATQQEVKAKAEIISLLPQLKALVSAQDSLDAPELAEQVEKLYELVTKWNPLTAWFRDDEPLLRLYFDILSKVRLFLIRRKGPSEQSNALVGGSLESIRQSVEQLSSMIQEIRVTVKTLLEIVSPNPEVHARIAGLSGRALELEQRIADFEATGGRKTDADTAKIQRWTEDLQKINQQIATLRRITKKE
jgi:hypothetical protein